MRKQIICHSCGAKLNKDSVALNNKILGRSINELKCLTCLADYLSCEEDDLLIKIEEFKEQGCALFFK